MPNHPAPTNFWRWFDPRNRQIGYWAFILNRITALGLTLYLVLHLIALSQLSQGAAAFVRFRHNKIHGGLKVGFKLLQLFHLPLLAQCFRVKARSNLENRAFRSNRCGEIPLRFREHLEEKRHLPRSKPTCV